MNESQIKAQIIIIRSIDWVLFALVLGIGIPALMYSDNQFIALIFILVGLGIVRVSGNWTIKRIATLKFELEKLERKEKADL